MGITKGHDWDLLTLPHAVGGYIISRDRRLFKWPGQGSHGASEHDATHGCSQSQVLPIVMRELVSMRLNNDFGLRAVIVSSSVACIWESA